METFSDSSGLRRIRQTDILVDLEPLTSGGYSLSFYPAGAFSPSVALDSAAAVSDLGDHPWRRIQIEPVAGAVELRILHVQPNGTAETPKKASRRIRSDHEGMVAGDRKATPLSNARSRILSIVRSPRLSSRYPRGSDVVRPPRKKKDLSADLGQSDIQTVVSDFEGNDYTSNFQFSSDAERTWLQSVQHESGNWEYYDHDYFGRITRVYRPFQNTPSTPGKAAFREK